MTQNRSAKRTLDCSGLYCPMPVLNTRREMDKMAIGDTLEVLADDPAAEEDIKAWAKRTGQELLEIKKTGEGWRFLIRKVK
jgi:tRNA 2-thiouridine synthesizing protein A